MMWYKRISIATLPIVCIAILGCAVSTQNQADAGNASIISYARNINLRLADVPQYVRVKSPRARVTTLGPFGAEVENCDGVGSRAGKTVGVTSQTFENSATRHRTVGLFPMDRVQSAVYVLSSPALARREVGAVISPLGRKCLKDSILRTRPPVWGGRR